ncbi:MAG: hypothetical protein EPO12_14360 [Aquabacterium sp.]|nr:MAG: hypothetical protein EPO12_14360 [Aquabacterium sp.]
MSRLPLLAALLIAGGVAGAAPYVPADDERVVETLPAGLRPPPRGLPLGAALAHAQEAIAAARRSGDPRWLGSARAVLTPWWAQADPPPGVRLLRATIRQSTHAFGEALLDLDALLAPGRAVPPGVRAQALLTRATVHQVRGDWAAARADCRLLQPLAPVPATACLAELQGLAGRQDDARAAFDDLAAGIGDGEGARWLAVSRAELAERSGHGLQAEAHYRAALGLRARGERPAPDADPYALGAYADLLLDQRRAAEVPPLLQGRERVDGLLLRLALAWQQLGEAARLRQAATALQARFDAARERGEQVHLREEARFELQVKGRAAVALALARADWAVQKEPADARLLWAAALAAGEPSAAEPVRRFVREQGLRDQRLAAAGAWP